MGGGPVRIGDKVRACFRTGPEATHTCLDLFWERESLRAAGKSGAYSI